MATFIPCKFDRPAEYQQAMLALIASAERELKLFEDDFEIAGIASREFADALNERLTASDALTITLLALQPDHIARYAPRILDLRQTWSHRFTMLRVGTVPELWHAGFAIADDERYVKRHHFDWPRGEASDDAREIAGLNHVFDELLQLGESALDWHRMVL
ncbi:DUF7931 domain-containing protein [Chitiniphilus eburneus]|uniref:DUF7931 domain-containing protein n=1 Tax=Chitiniphilus eburneus TaxID=2571148 RepID=A0A4U0PDL8_9NEIS|nr:hypothetical protein [Chitiniphilus eburneus]TJZ65895.1 hypothetical protein FAZ21_17760 [Chitiniphilus eburneus]